MRNSSSSITKRVVIYPKDVALLTGRSTRTSQQLLQQIRVQLGKEKNAFVTVPEFARYTGIAEEIIYQHLQ